ncbi:MAG: ASKHA domain-containing protein, partial [Thermoplasmata archaeon]|nr:ASKHA domain-containing protein [Thermoplasmata archaeon]
DWTVTATVADLEGRGEITRLESGDKCGCLLGLAVDIGTTTVVGQLIDLLTGNVVASASEYNRQISRGEDVIARMMYSEEGGGRELTSLARATVNSVIGKLLDDVSRGRESPVTTHDLVGASIAGNTIMTHFFVGVDTRFIRLEPYVPVAHHMPPRSGYDLGLDIHPSSEVLLFPSRAGYLGGDVVADVLASGMHRGDDITMLIDVGTNGEIVLGCDEWLVSCACSAGPAFEGGEVSCGMRAMHGAMDRIRVNDDLTSSYHVIGEEPPNGICGSGLIDLIAEMYEHGVIDRKARIQALPTDRVRRTDEGLEFVVERRDRLGNGAPADLVVTDADLQNVLRTKAAIFGAATVLLKKMDEDLDDLDSLVIAGGFGNHLDIDRAVSIGMFPDIPREKYRFIGNGALEGARLALLSEDMRNDMVEIFEEMTYIELSVDNDFYDEFSSSLFIPHTDLEKFPSFRERKLPEGAK